MPSRSQVSSATASPESSELFIALGAVVKRLRHNPITGDEALRAALQGRSPAPRHIAALLHVAAEEGIGMSDLADQLGISLATASQVITDLADWGLVERATDDTDRRRTIVSVVPAHRPTTRALIESRMRPLQRTLRRLEPDERAALIRGLTVLGEELDATKGARR